MNARLLVSLGVAGVVALVSGLAIRRTSTVLERELGTLVPQMDVMASGWDRDKVPFGQRVVTILLSDSGAAFDPFVLAPEVEEGFVESTRGWIGRNLIGGNAAVPTATSLARAYGDSTQLIGWTHKGFAAAGEAAMSRELEKAILKAHDAGAEINIVAQGKASGAVLAALKRAQDVERGGSKVGANKVILLGVNSSRLGAGFAKPANVLELAAVWSTREIGSRMQMQVYDARRAGEKVDLETLWPGIGAGGDSVDKSVRLLRGFTESAEPLERFIARQEDLLNEARAKKAAEDAERARASAVTEAKARPAASLAPSKPAEPAKNTPAPRPASDANGWPSAALRDYSTAMDGTDIGWLFSAPPAYLNDLSQEHTGTTLPNDKTRLSTAQCSQTLHVKAVNAKKLGAGDRDGALLKLWDQESGVSMPMKVDKITRLKIHGYPANLIRITYDWDPPGERSYLVVETGRHLLYLVLVSSYLDETREACVNSHMPLFQAVAKSIRPNAR